MTNKEAIVVLRGLHQMAFSLFPDERCETVKNALKIAMQELAEEKQTNTAKYIHIDDVYKLVAGHSDYHGDSILSAFTCITEGKNVKDITPLEKQTNTAEWKIENNGGTTMWYECSKCGEAGDIWDKFCKHCGRKMTNAVEE